MRQPWALRTAVDGALMMHTELDEVTLARLRREFHRQYKQATYAQRKAWAEGGTSIRFVWVNAVMEAILTRRQWLAWLLWLEHTERDIVEMQTGKYPISPVIVRRYSALLGIKVDFLLLGTAPAADPMGANINVWPPPTAPTYSREAGWKL